MEAVSKDERRAFPETKKRKITNSVVAQPETANTVDSQPVKDPSPFRFTWKIDRFSQLKAKKLYSDVFEVGGFKWRILIFPKGNNVDSLSMYLDVADSANLPYGWSRYAQFSMKVVDQINNKYSVRKDMQHLFNKRESDWGFTSFMPLSELFDPSRGFILKNALVVEVEVTCIIDDEEASDSALLVKVKERLKKEHRENKHRNKEKEETHLYTVIKVVRDEDIAEQIGKDIYFDLVDYDKVKSFHVQKKTSFNVFKEEAAKEFGIPARFQRFWVLGKRQNHTYRPFRPLTHIEEAGPVGQLKVLNKVHKETLKLFLEVERGPDLRPIAPVNKGDDDVLLFFKLYDPEKEELRYVGRLFVNCTDKPSKILTRLNKLAGYDPDEEIELYEEIMFKPNVMCEPVDKKLTFQESELGNGDIICFQKASEMVNENHFRYPDVPSYLEYVHDGQVPYLPSAKETTHDVGSSKFNTSEFVSIDLEEIDAMIDEDVIAAIDRVLSKGVTISLKSQHSVEGQEVAKMDPELPEQLLQELRDIAFKEDLVEKYKEGLTPKVNFNVLKDKIDANADLFSSHQLEQVDVVVSLLNNIARVFEKLENLKKERDSAKKSTDQDNEVLKETRHKILNSKTSFTNHQTQLNSLDAKIAVLKAKLEKLQGERAKIAEVQDQEKGKITSLNKEVKSIFHRIANDQIKLKSVEYKIPEAQTELESHEKVYKIFKASPPF